MSAPEPICEREYVAVCDGKRVPFLVRWMKPKPHDEGDWRCDYTFTLATEVVREASAYGVDSTQALVLAFSKVASELETRGFPIFWFEEGDSLGLSSDVAVQVEADRASRRASNA